MNRSLAGRGRFRLRSLLFAVATVAVVFAVPAGPAEAAKHTPLAWRRLVQGNFPQRFLEQRKHVGWNRDLDFDFVDDEIARRFSSGDSVDLVVELNDCMPPSQIRRKLGRYGTVTYAGRLVSCAFMRDVPFDLIDSIAAMPEVAMVEWQAPIRPLVGNVTRAIQAAYSRHYVDDTDVSDGGGSVRDANGVGPSGVGAGDEGIVVAILDTGVANEIANIPWSGSTGSGMDGSFAGGFDATVYEDTDDIKGDDSIGSGTPCTYPCEDEPGDGKTDPAPTTTVAQHGTQVASIALARARGLTPPLARSPAGEPTGPNGGGVAPGARLLDVKVLEDVSTDIDRDDADGDVMQGLDWVGEKQTEFAIRVVNLSLSDALDCNGGCALCQAVDYLAGLGIVMVAGHGNADCEKRGDCPPKKSTRSDGTEVEIPQAAAGDQRTGSPAAASHAITVAGTNDWGTSDLPTTDPPTVDRSDDAEYRLHLIGPRTTPPDLTSDPNGYKPDLAAPAEEIEAVGESGDYIPTSGTSMAAPAVAGAAAVLLGIDGTIDPAGMKALLIETADDAVSGGAAWDEKFGAGILNLFAAMKSIRKSDVHFPSCFGPALTPGAPCPLTGGLPSYLNLNDIQVPASLQVGVETTMSAAVTNTGTAKADGVKVIFGIYYFGTGSKVFYELATVVTDLDAGATKSLSINWTPQEEGHRCAQVRIVYPFDTEFGNNVTQRNLTIAASRYEMRVENPFMVPAQFTVVPSSEREDWPCTVNLPTFRIGGPEDCPKTVQIDFNAPRNSRFGSRANCNVEVYAKPDGAADSSLIGGVTVQTYVPRPCRVIGQIVDPAGRPIRGVRLSFKKVLPEGILPASWEKERRGKSDRDGVFDLDVLPDAHQILRARLRGVGDFSIPVIPNCGVGTIRLELSSAGLRLLSTREGRSGPRGSGR